MGGFIAPATLEQIRAANDIIDVISAVVPLKRAGASFVALCPFHRERTPSFHVNPRKQTFHCFGCHKGGDVFTFIREYETVDFPEAIKRLAERARIPLQFEKDPQYQERQFVKEKLFQINEQITQRWHACLLNEAGGERARNYLGERAVSPEAVNLFRLGFSPEPWEDTINWAKSKSFDLALLEQAGLAIRKEGTSDFYGRFRGRLMFPICDDQGRVIGFSGRVLPGTDDTRKYVNSPETPLFLKSRVIFGLDKSKRAILEKQFAIVCEGQIDLIACFMAGVQNIVAPQGTAFTSEHARIIKRYASEVVLCFDSDEAGQKAAVRVLDDLLGCGLAIRVATLPAPHDPDSFIKDFGAPAFEELIQKAEGFFDYYLNRLCRQNDIRTDKGQQAVLTAMAEAVQKTGDAALFDKYAQRTAGRLGVSPFSAVQRFKEVAARKTVRRETEAPVDENQNGAPDPQEIIRPNSQEFWLLKILLHHDEVLEWTRAHLHPEWIHNEAVREIVRHRLALGANGDPIQPGEILNRIESPHLQSLITEALAEERLIPKPEQQLTELALRLRNQSIDREMASLRQSMANLPEDAGATALGELAALQQAKRVRLIPLPT
ncbi:MAG TPA: DNA primase [Verrucomicrobiae bacterium]|jgi:DNA primase|nr:DNA primase [Verrucomicrobiae bacterium]